MTEPPTGTHVIRLSCYLYSWTNGELCDVNAIMEGGMIASYYPYARFIEQMKIGVSRGNDLESSYSHIEQPKIEVLTHVVLQRTKADLHIWRSAHERTRNRRR